MIMRKRIFAGLLSAIMAVSSLQFSTVTVLAEENAGVTEDTTVWPEEEEKEETELDETEALEQSDADDAQQPQPEEPADESENDTVPDDEENFVPAEESEDVEDDNAEIDAESTQPSDSTTQSFLIDLESPYDGNYILAANVSINEEGEAESVGELPASDQASYNMWNSIGYAYLEDDPDVYDFDENGREIIDPASFLPELVLDESGTEFQADQESASESYYIGFKRNFYLNTTADSQYNSVDCICVAISEYATVWVPVEDPIYVADPELMKGYMNQLAEEFDTQFPKMTEMFGSKETADRVYGDNDGKTALICYDINGNEMSGSSYTAGYFYGADLNANYSNKTNNNIDCLHIDSWQGMDRNTSNNTLNPIYSKRTMVHELQHMINYSICRDNETRFNNLKVPTYLNEAYSEAAAHLCYGEASNRIYYYNYYPYISSGKVSLLKWGGYDTLSNYALSYLFSQYIRTQYENDDTIYRDTMNALNESTDLFSVIADKLGVSGDELLFNFRAALFLKNAQGPYGFGGEEWAESVRSNSTQAVSGLSLAPGAAVVLPISDSFEPVGAGSNIRFAGMYSELTGDDIEVHISGGDSITENEGTLQLSASVYPKGVSQSVIFSLPYPEDGAYAQVTKSGLVTALVNGTVTVRASSVFNPSKYADITITISGQHGMVMFEKTETPVYGGIRVAYSIIRPLGAVLYYTIDGETPTYESEIMPDEGILFDTVGTHTLKLLAHDADGVFEDHNAEEEIVIRQLNEPVIISEIIEIDDIYAQRVTIEAEEGSEVYYTTDGSEPTMENGMLYEEPFTIDILGTTMLKAIAVKEGMAVSDVALKEITVEYDDSKPGNENNYTLNRSELEFNLSSEHVETVKLTVKSGEKDISSTVTWSTSDESVAKVSKGIVTPTGVGNAKIRAAIKNGPTLTCNVTVTRDKLEDISLGDSECTLNVGDTKQMKVYLTPNDATISRIFWESDNPQLVAVEANNGNHTTATVRALAVGKATITVTVTPQEGEPLERKCTVTVRKDITEEGISNRPTGLMALTNEQFTLDEVELPEGWEWLYPDVSLKQFAGIQSKTFAAQYTTKEEGAASYVTSLPVALSTVTGISIGADSSSVHTGGTKVFTINWNMNGSDVDMFEYADKITWSIDKPNVAELSTETGLTTTLTAKNAGSATIKAQVSFRDKAYKAQYKVIVTNSDVANADIRIVSVEKFTSDADIDTIAASTYSYIGESLPDSGTILVTMTNATKLTVKSNNTKVISVGKVTSAENNYTIPITVNAAGTAQITLTANDAAKTQEVISLSVTDAKPNISEDTITVNLQQTTGTAFFLYPNAGYEVIDAELAGDAADLFTLDQPTGIENGSYVIKAKEGTAKGTYKLSLKGKVKMLQGSTQGTAVEKNYSDTAFTVKVVNQAPKYKVKQSTKVNLFYKDSASLLEIISDEALINAELAEDCDFKVEKRNESYYIVPRIAGLETNSCDKKGTLTLKFNGYEDVTVNNYTVAVEKKAPKITFASTSVTLYPSVGLNSTIVKVKGSLDEGTTVTLDDIGKNAGFSINESDGQWLLIGTGLTKKATVKPKLIFRNNLWGEEEVKVSYTINVSMGTPAAKLQKNSLQLNINTDYMAYDAASTEVMWKNGALFEPVGVSVSAVDAKAQGIINRGVVFRFDESENQMIATLNNIAVAKGSYKFKVNVKVTDTLTVSTPLTIKIVNVAKDKAVKVSSKGSIDVLNRQGTFVTVTPALKSLNGTIIDVKLSGRAEHLFDAVCEDNKVIIHAKDNVALITKYNYKVKLDLIIRNTEGDTIQYTTHDVNLKLKQGKPKVSVTPKQTTFFSGANNSIRRNISAALKGTDNPVITDVELMNNREAFILSYANGVITLNNTQDAIKGKTYSLQLKVTFEGQADNEKVTIIKYSVKVK